MTFLKSRYGHQLYKAHVFFVLTDSKKKKNREQHYIVIIERHYSTPLVTITTMAQSSICRFKKHKMKEFINFTRQLMVIKITYTEI